MQQLNQINEVWMYQEFPKHAVERKKNQTARGYV